jgi:hypothetical protein
LSKSPVLGDYSRETDFLDDGSGAPVSHAHILFDKTTGEYRLFNDHWYPLGSHDCAVSGSCSVAFIISFMPAVAYDHRTIEKNFPHPFQLLTPNPALRPAALFLRPRATVRLAQEVCGAGDLVARHPAP